MDKIINRVHTLKGQTLKDMSFFKEKVYRICSSIPKGKVATYGQLARLAGNPKAGRAVGVLMKNNPYAPRVPCHRVVGKDGNLVGYSAKDSIIQKREILIKEGVYFKKDKVDLRFSLLKK